MQEGKMGPSDKAYFRILRWETVQLALEGDGECGREGLYTPLSLV